MHRVTPPREEEVAGRVADMLEAARHEAGHAVMWLASANDLATASVALPPMLREPFLSLAPGIGNGGWHAPYLLLERVNWAVHRETGDQHLLVRSGLAVHVAGDLAAGRENAGTLSYWLDNPALNGAEITDHSNVGKCLAAAELLFAGRSQDVLASALRRCTELLSQGPVEASINRLALDLTPPDIEDLVRAASIHRKTIALRDVLALASECGFPTETMEAHMAHCGL